MTIKKKSTIEQADIKATGIAIMGGTFDPIHNGHLQTAVEILDRYAYSELKLIPCFQPVHKKKVNITPQQRLDMVRLATSGYQRLNVDSREIDREGLSYSIDTLRELRLEIGPDTPLVMVLGMDSFLSLPSWYAWEDIIKYAHILVVSRPGWVPMFTPELQAFDKNYRALSSHELQCTPSGRIWLDTLTPLEISSTLIRTLLNKQESIAYLLPKSVQKYIEQHQLYQ